jgi:hypothetical protein
VWREREIERERERERERGRERERRETEREPCAEPDSCQTAKVSFIKTCPANTKLELSCCIMARNTIV